MAFPVGSSGILSTLDPDLIEDGRADIYKWSETRRSKRKGFKGKLYQFKKLFIDKSVSRIFYLFSSSSIHRQLNYLPEQVSCIAILNCIFESVQNYFILQILRTFVYNLTVILFLQMVLAGEDKS